MPVHMTTRESLRIYGLADIWAARTAKAVRLVSANDHVHARGSAHYAGMALDFLSSDPDGLSTMFRQEGYRVLWRVPGHYGHLHVEQPRLGDSPPPPYSSQVLRRATAVRPRTGPRIGG
jgi:hypothetical protein